LANKMKSIDSATWGGMFDMLIGKKDEGKEMENKLVEEFRQTLDQTKRDMNQRLLQLNTILSECKHQQPSAFQSLHDSISKSMGDMSNMVTSLTSQLQHKLASPFQRWTQPKNKYLLQSSNYQPGLTITYTNDNGEEVLDVNGEKADESLLDKLKTLNEFRSEFNLPPAESLGNVSFYIHQLKQPRVLVKATKVLNDIQYKYQYDNGMETMNVTLSEGDPHSPLQAVDDMKALDTFRLAFGISPKQGPQPLSTTYHHVLTSKKGKDEL